PLWSTVGSQQPIISSTHFVSPGVSAYFNTTTTSADGYARRYINEAKEYEISFWYRLDAVNARTHLVSIPGPLGRAMGVEAQAQGARLMLREACYDTEILTPIGNYQMGVWRRIVFRQVGGRTVVDLDGDGNPDLDKATQFLPAYGNEIILGDPSTVIYSGSGYSDDLVVTRWDNTYPAEPRITPIDVKFPDVVA